MKPKGTTSSICKWCKKPYLKNIERRNYSRSIIVRPSNSVTCSHECSIFYMRRLRK